MIEKNVDFECVSNVQVIVYSVKDGSAVFVVPNSFVVLEVPVSQDQVKYFKMYEKSTKVFMLHGKAKFHYVRDCEVELVGFAIESSELTTQLVNQNLFAHIETSDIESCIYDDKTSLSINTRLYC